MLKTSMIAAAVVAFAAPAVAQTYAPHGGYYRGAPVGYYDDITTGSISPAQGVTPPGVMAAPERAYENPAAAGNAEQQNKPVPNFGNVSGGPLAGY